MNIDSGDRIRDYVVQKKLGEGGMGTVYLATDEILLRKVAIKVLNPILTRDNQLVERFRQEARLQSTLTHPNILTLHAFFSEHGNYYMVMEFAEGETLKSLIERTGPISEKRALGVFRQTAAAAEYAHSKGIIHRDIKPGNIMVGMGDSVKVMDFGIAKAIGDQGLTKTGAKLGTLYYMSPEQVKGMKDVDRRTDIYSLGVTLYEMLTGRLPFDSDTESEFQIMQQIVVQGLFDAATLRKIENVSLRQLISNMTGKEREHRFNDCREVVNAIEHVREMTDDEQNGKVVVDGRTEANTRTRHIGAKERTTNWSMRAFIASGAILLAIVGIVWFSSQKAQEGFIERRVNEPAKTRPVPSVLPTKVHFSASRPYGLSFKFSSDSKLVFLENRWKEPTIYETFTGKVVTSIAGHEDGITGTAFSPSGEYLITGSKDQSARIWSTETGNELCAKPGNSWELQSVQFSPDGSSFCVASEDKKLRLYETSTWAELATFSGFKDRISGVAFSPDGVLLATASWDRHVRVWRVPSRELVFDVIAHDYGVSGVCFSPDGGSFFSASIDRKIKQWTINSKSAMRVFVGHRLDVYSVVCSPNGRFIASSSADKTVRIWDIESGNEVFTLRGHTEGVRSVNFSPDGRYVVSVSWDGTGKLWDTTTGELVHTYL